MELDVVAEVEIEGKKYKVVEVPSAHEFKGFPPSWDFVRTKIMSWRPFFKGKLLDFNGMKIPVMGDYALNVDEEMMEVIDDIYNTFVLSRPNIEINMATIVDNQVNRIAAREKRHLSEEEVTALNIRIAVELAILKDIGLIL